MTFIKYLEMVQDSPEQTERVRKKCLDSINHILCFRTSQLFSNENVYWGFKRERTAYPKGTAISPVPSHGHTDSLQCVTEWKRCSGHRSAGSACSAGPVTDGLHSEFDITDEAAGPKQREVSPMNFFTLEKFFRERDQTANRNACIFTIIS